MRVLMIAPPGAGKGTQGALIAAKAAGGGLSWTGSRLRRAVTTVRSESRCPLLIVSKPQATLRSTLPLR